MCYKTTREIAGDYARQNQELTKQLEQPQNQYEQVVKQNQSLQQELQPFRQIYFKNMPTVMIAEMAKSQLKTTTQLINAETLIDFILQTLENASDINAKRIIKQEISKYRGLNYD